MKDFDKEFDSHFKKASKLFWLAICIKAILVLGLFGGITYVAIHFLQKVW
ncbi:hypothetical protein [Brevibacillus laterosporus]|nr:hypothetical protein [Brevibacillus laterosporus]